jgi:MoCo/4Fe-4S cofactor protein with predicted Tat translocation signal
MGWCLACHRHPRGHSVCAKPCLRRAPGSEPNPFLAPNTQRSAPIPRNGTASIRNNPAPDRLYGMSSMTPRSLTDLQKRIPVSGGTQLWKSLDQLADTPEFREAIEREFPIAAAEWPDALSRRRFLTLMGVSLAAAGLASCSRQPIERLVPYVKQPEDLIPGKPLHFASSHVLGGFARGVRVESHEGAPDQDRGQSGP